MPSGGQKDTLAPTLAARWPEQGATNFAGQELWVEFDEFVQLNNIAENLVVSPPMDPAPKVALKGRTLVVELPEPPRDSTTYSLSFGGGIGDFHENNLLQDFQMVFSTGAHIDSFAIAGSLFDLWTRTPPEAPMWVGAYPADLPRPRELVPSFVAKTDAKGNFRLANLPRGSYQLLAFADLNRNLLFDLPAEKVAFLDSLVSPSFEVSTSRDTLFSDSLPGQVDTVIVRRAQRALPDSLRLGFFAEDKAPQRVADYLRPEQAHLRVFFDKPLGPLPLRLESDSAPAGLAWREQLSPGGDTLDIWLIDSTLWNQSRLTLRVSFPLRDSLGQWTLQTDTFQFDYDKAEPVLAPPFLAKHNLQGQFKENGRPLLFDLGLPIAAMVADSVRLSLRADTLARPLPLTLLPGAGRFDQAELAHAWLPETDYVLELMPGALRDAYGRANDSLRLEFSTRPANHHARLEVVLLGPSQTALLILLDESGKELRRQAAQVGQTAAFDFLGPAKYQLKAFLDLDQDGLWTPGDWDRRRLPEPVFFYPETFEMRSGWTNQLEWRLEE